MRLAVVHDYFTQVGGAERVVAHWARQLSPVSVGAIVADPALALGDLRYSEVGVTRLNALGLARQKPQYLLPVMPYFARRIPVAAEADALLVSTSGFAHMVRSAIPKIVYWHTPARWLYADDDYRLGLSSLEAAALTGLQPWLRSTDRKAISLADRHLCNSRVTQRRLATAYGIEAAVVHPPVGLALDPPTPPPVQLPSRFFLTVGRPRAYKNADLVVRAARSAGVSLVQVGGRGATGDDRGVTRVKGISDGELNWLYAHAEAVVSASREDFGLTTIEGYQAGAPSLTIRAGGFLESCVEGVTGEFFEGEDVSACAKALANFDARRYSREAIREHGARFRPEEHAKELLAHVEQHAANLLPPA